MSSSQAIALCHCSTCAKCWCGDVLQDTLSMWSLTCGCSAELKARLESEVAHLTRLPRKGFMEVGYFRMMDMAEWFCRRRGRGHEVMKPSCKHLSLLLPCLSAQRFPHDNLCSENSSNRCPCTLSGVLSKVKKKVVHAQWQKTLLPLTRLEKSSLFQRFPFWVWARSFHFLCVWTFTSLKKSFIFLLLGQVSGELLLNSPCQYLHRNAQYLLELGQGLNSVLIWCNEFQQLIACWVKIYYASEMFTGRGCKVTHLDLGFHFRAFVYLPVEP